MRKKSDEIVKYQRQKSDELYHKVYRDIQEMLLNSEKINFYTVAERAEVSRTYLYHHLLFSSLIKTVANLQKHGKTVEDLVLEYKQSKEVYENTMNRYSKTKEKLEKLRSLT